MLSLTSDAFVLFLRIALVAALVWIVLRWASAARTTVLSVVRRVVSLCAVMLLAVLNVIVPINAEYGWYGSWDEVWTELTSDATAVPAAQPAGAAPQTAANADVGPSPLAALPTSGRDRLPVSLTPTSSGGYQTFSVRGPKSGVTGDVTVWFPPGYEQDRAASHPVLEVFHGFLPAPLATFRVFHLDSIIENLVQGRQMRAPVVVIPHWAPDKVDTECVDGGGSNPAMETWVTQDVPQWLHGNFRADTERDSWATMGYSAGGWCSLMSTMLHPTTFGAAISLGGYARPTLDPPYVPFGPKSRAGQRYDLVALTKKAPPAVALWTLTSKQDKQSSTTTTALVDAARAPLSVTPTVLTQGSHRAEVWEPYFEPALEWLARTSTGFAATG